MTGIEMYNEEPKPMLTKNISVLSFNGKKENQETIEATERNLAQECINPNLKTVEKTTGYEPELKKLNPTPLEKVSRFSTLIVQKTDQFNTKHLI